MRPWWERFPGRLEQEIASLEARGIEHRKNELAWKDGQLVLNLRVPGADGAQLELVAHYPDLFPYMRFEVFAAGLSLPRHQNPFSSNLCLMGRATSNWSVDDKLGEVLERKLPDILRFANEDAAALRDLEEPQGEPVTDYYTYAQDSAVLVDSDWKIDPKVSWGQLTIAYSSKEPFRGAVTGILDVAGRDLLGARPPFASFYSKAVPGRWVRLQAPIIENDPRRILAELSRYIPGLMKPSLSKKRALDAGHPEVIGVLFPEEVAQNVYMDGWIFLIRTKQRLHLARACRAGRADLRSRAPELASLPNKRVTLIGSGSVGAPVAIGLARHGVGHITLLDYDIMEAGTSARWPLGLAAAGRNKIDALATFIRENYPYTETKCHVGMIGRAQRPSAPQYCDWRDFDGLFSSDLIVDCTAEVGVNLLLADTAAERGVPYICASATPGGWGGVVFRQLPGTDEACWSCLRHAMTGGTVPTPPQDEVGELQPVGCASPTFTGAGVDLEEVSLMALRTAISTLCRGARTAYPDLRWNVAVLALRDAAGALTAPQWTTRTVGRHPACCNVRAHSDDLAVGSAA